MLSFVVCMVRVCLHVQWAPVCMFVQSHVFMLFTISKSKFILGWNSEERLLQCRFWGESRPPLGSSSPSWPSPSHRSPHLLQLLLHLLLQLLFPQLLLQPLVDLQAKAREGRGLAQSPPPPGGKVKRISCTWLKWCPPNLGSQVQAGDGGDLQLLLLHLDDGQGAVEEGDRQVQRDVREVQVARHLRNTHVSKSK